MAASLEVGSQVARGEEARFDWARSLPFFGVHLACGLAFLTQPGWIELGLLVGVFAVRMFAVTAGYHRYFSHRTFRTGRVFQFLLAALAVTSVQKGVLWWAAHHRDHHRFSDTPRDVHSPVQRGFWWSHVGWILSTQHGGTDTERIKDFNRFPELRWLERWHLLPFITLCVVAFALGGLSWLVWGCFMSTVVLWHATFAINSLAHVAGRRRYPTPDQSRNNWALALLTGGEGWHNNHHYFPGSTRQGFFWWEVDFTYYVLRGLAAIGVVSDLREPPTRVFEEARRLRRTVGAEAGSAG